MNSKYPIRNNIRILLLNDNDELLLMCIDDPRTKPIDGEYGGRFWTSVGGEIEDNEDNQKAAIRELTEETGLSKDDVEFGPVVWIRELDILLYGKPTHIKEQFIVAKTKKKNVFLSNLTEEEIDTVKQLNWFSLDDLANCEETIFPESLSHYLPDIIKGNYPKEPLDIENKSQ